MSAVTGLQLIRYIHLMVISVDEVWYSSPKNRAAFGQSLSCTDNEVVGCRSNWVRAPHISTPFQRRYYMGPGVFQSYVDFLCPCHRVPHGGMWLPDRLTCKAPITIPPPCIRDVTSKFRITIHVSYSCGLFQSFHGWAEDDNFLFLWRSADMPVRSASRLRKEAWCVTIDK